MRERPILFSTPMVQAILEGRKTMTRRVVKPRPVWKERDGLQSAGWSWKTPKIELNAFPEDKGFSDALLISCPYGTIGDRLWVRETWRESGNLQLADNSIPKIGNVSEIIYKADNNEPLDTKWRPSIFMPRYASRITLEITKVRVEQLRDISSEDCEAEGIEAHCDDGIHDTGDALYLMFKILWKKINGAESWESNPWVWVIEFERVKQ